MANSMNLSTVSSKPFLDGKQENPSEHVWQIPDLFFHIFSFLGQLKLTSREQWEITIYSSIRVCKQWNRDGLAYVVKSEKQRISNIIEIISNSKPFTQFDENQKRLQSIRQKTILSEDAGLIKIAQNNHILNTSISKSLKAVHAQVDVLRDIARDLAKINEIESAIHVADAIPSACGYVKTRAYQKILYFCKDSTFKETLCGQMPTNLDLDTDEEYALVESGELSRDYLDSYDSNMWVRTRITEGCYTEAKEIANKISDKDEQSLAFGDIAQAMVSNGYIQEAMEIILMIIEKDVQEETALRVTRTMYQLLKTINALENPQPT